MTSQASSTITAKGSAARIASRRFAAPTTVAPTTLAARNTAAPASALSNLACATYCSDPIRRLFSTALIPAMNTDNDFHLSSAAIFQFHVAAIERRTSISAATFSLSQDTSIASSHFCSSSVGTQTSAVASISPSSSSSYISRKRSTSPLLLSSYSTLSSSNSSGCTSPQPGSSVSRECSPTNSELCSICCT